MTENNVLLSVIIPIYNAEATLERCLDSIIRQNLENMEILCIDDGSQDGSMQICKSYQEKDKRIITFHKKNEGVAATREFGLERAGGTYVTFVDQDDWLENEAYGVAIEKLFKEKAEMLVFNYSKDYENKVLKMNNLEAISDIIENKDDLIRYAFAREAHRGFAAFLWNKIYKMDFLKENHITFDTSLRRGDDVLFFAKCAVNNPKTVYIDECWYHYFQRESSVTHTLSLANLDRLSDILTGYEKAIEVLEERSVSQEALGYVKCFYVYHASLLCELGNSFGIPTDKYKIIIKKYLNEYITQNKNQSERIERIYRLIEE